ncbi:hypothetical protein P0W64_18550 [Tsukamurella sp. 8F]|uniref:hypothetical protein n=1 Tax=unclassified Tsukamurella TaxID=2633480 RepID=UPI0023B995B2|nr:MULTISPECIES: hypothetical protein [unclassified Tsukamurella]MDF0531644.1 hypothetical protein [Tsukamurella sp. 8J]MDF0588788.1 hypothetical protein [Tsukamurella sp. 8F]
MDQVTVLFSAIWKILVIGLILGAGLPALFAVGVRGIAMGNGHEAADGQVHKPNPLGNVIAAVAFIVVVVAVVIGLMVIVAPGFGMKVSFDNIYPTLVDKK